MGARLPLFFSGTESAAQRLIQSGACQTELAYAVYDAMARTFHKLIVNAACDTGIDCALIAGSGLKRPAQKHADGKNEQKGAY